MAGYYLTGNLSDRPKAKLYVTDFSKPKTLIGARTAFYLKSPDLPSPMGMNVSAFNDMEELRAIQSKYSGTVLTWDDVLALWSKVHG
jgi:copper chaperone NosL